MEELCVSCNHSLALHMFGNCGICDCACYVPKSSMQNDVMKFHMTYGQPVALSPQPLPTNRVDLRLGLIKEEVDELEEALLKGDLVETYDAALDILYVTFGLLVEMGIDAQVGFDEVQRSNMSKLGADGMPIRSRGIDIDGFPEGKVLKGPNYFKPDLQRVLTELGMQE